MTFEALLNLDPDRLEAMTDEEILKHLTPYLELTTLPEDFRPGASIVNSIDKPEPKPSRKSKTKPLADAFDSLTKEEKLAKIKALCFEE